MKQFISEFAENMSEHVKQRLLELGERCILTRKDEEFILDLKHVEHNKYSSTGVLQDKMALKGKEYVYGEFIMHDGNMYFSEKCMENDNIVETPAVKTIYASLCSEDMILEDGINGKIVNDENIDFIVDSILKVCPKVSDEYLKIISRYKKM
jgi:hypothetical protein